MLRELGRERFVYNDIKGLVLILYRSSNKSAGVPEEHVGLLKKFLTDRITLNLVKDKIIIY